MNVAPSVPEGMYTSASHMCRPAVYSCCHRISVRGSVALVCDMGSSVSYTHRRRTPPLSVYRWATSRFQGFCTAYVYDFCCQPSVGEARVAARAVVAEAPAPRPPARRPAAARNDLLDADMS